MHQVRFTKEHAYEIFSWRYPPPFDFYNLNYSEDAFKELTEDHYFAVFSDENEMIGFYCTGQSAQVPSGQFVRAYDEPAIDIGFGLKPAWTGRGFGAGFCSFIFAKVRVQQDCPLLRLTVASFNQRAIKLYRKLGFQPQKSFYHNQIEFLTMVKSSPKERITVVFNGKKVMLKEE
ncbi:GNAT family N-acetyltransferase [Alkalihalobacillus pseudalcaliphilus]|uniref:GNAT family N-acetyltransferase n=1 Tax=Alkalihalobacillus pseudalcaliphilus TaxID=79884 RepID=UPI00064DBB71|nr:GNAT family N-acetyltransferase [Alkalihalobacillus pseudalcaliphilus]KMK75809.1 hypothetical protein AB990_11110 [Alkalihalobacillus pseudalcaliphilus]